MTSEQKEAVVNEITLALGDPIARKSKPWWTYFFAVTELGVDVVREFVQEVFTIEARGGMATNDGSRRRSPGGVFFVLVRERLGPRRMGDVRGRARRQYERRLLKRFLRLLVMLWPEAPPGSAPEDPSPAAKAVEIEPAPKHAEQVKPSLSVQPQPETVTRSTPVTAETQKPAAATNAAWGSGSSKPRRGATPVVEVVVVRRRSS